MKLTPEQFDALVEYIDRKVEGDSDFIIPAYWDLVGLLKGDHHEES